MTESSQRKTVEKADLWNYVEKHKPQIENSLREYLPLAPVSIKTKFNEALEYALFSGGKRLRPVICLLGAELVGGAAETVLPAAAAVEFVHTSSLIFDDLPAMDDASERRGKTSLHEKYGEGLAILVALGLLNASYGLVFEGGNLPERAVEAHRELVECVGAAGMLGGQSVDLALAKGADSSSSSGADYNFESVRNLKTSALMRLAVRIGAILAGANQTELAHLSRFAASLGNAYQLSDDLIDAEEDSQIFFEAERTFTIDRGEDAARLKLKNLIVEAKQNLIENFPGSEARNNLIQLTDYLAERKM